MKIHGHTKIELKNVKTGLVERIQSENVFQGQYIAEYLRSLGINQIGNFPLPSQTSSGSTNVYPLWKKVVGGLFLFRDAISDYTRFMPAGNVMVGAGVSNFTHSGSPSEWGSFNAVESSEGLSAITQVYDFTTDQANGQIGCVSLTSRRGAFIGYGHNGNTSLGNYTFDNEMSYIYQSDSPKGYTFKDSSNREWELQSYNVDTSKGLYQGVLWVTKKRCGITNASIFDTKYKILTFDLTQIGTNPFNLSGSSTTSGSYEIFPIGGTKFAITIQGEVVYSAGMRTVNSGSPIYWYELDADAETLELKSVINSTGTEVGYSDANGSTSCSFTTDGCIIVRKSNSPYNYYKINTSTGIVVKDFGSVITFADNYRSPGRNYGQEIAPGLQLFDSADTTYTYIYDTVNDTLKYINFQYNQSGVGLRNHPQYNALEQNFYGSRSSAKKMIPHPLYLATINNIQPVTKTAAQTMKVTYTLQEV